MTLRTNNNLMALTVQHAISGQSSRAIRQVETLSSGIRVKRASNDASGVAISEGLRADLAGLDQNIRNVEQAANLLQVAEGSLNATNRALLHMRELAVMASDSTLTPDQREVANSEFNQLRSDIDRLAQATTYNGRILLAGEGEAVVDQSTALINASATGIVSHNVSGAEPGTYVFTDSPGDAFVTLSDGENSQQINLGTILDAGIIPEGVKVRVNFDRLGLQITLSGGSAGGEGQYRAGALDGTTLKVEEGVGGSFQVGPDNEDFDRLVLDLPDLRASSTTLNLGKAAITSQSVARATIVLVDQAIGRISDERGRLGALQNRLGFTLSYSENEIENLQSSDSSIRDADMAHESTRFTRSEILANTGSAMMVQAFNNARLSLLLL